MTTKGRRSPAGAIGYYQGAGNIDIDWTPPEQTIQWLTNTKDTGSILIPWPEPGGPWWLEVEMARVDGRTMVVGLSVLSYFPQRDKSGRIVARVPGPLGLSEVNHSVIRDLRMGEITDQARKTFAVQAAVVAAMEAAGGTWPEPSEIARRLAPIFSRDEPRRRRPRAGEDELNRIAELYRAATVEAPRTPAKYVETQLRESGVDIDGPAVRKLIARAREQGMLPKANRKGAR